MIIGRQDDQLEGTGWTKQQKLENTVGSKNTVKGYKEWKIEEQEEEKTRIIDF